MLGTASSVLDRFPKKKKGGDMSRRKWLYLVLALVCIVPLVAISCAAPPAEEGREFLAIGTGSPGGVYYPLGGAMSVVIEKMTDHRCVAESTGASVENCRLVAKGMVDMGLAMGGVAYKATQGEDPFEEAYPLVALLNMYSSPLHILTTEGTGIKTIEDLAGKKISIDVPGAGCNVQSRIVLEAAGFDLETDLTIAELSQTEGVAALKDGTVHAMTLQAAFPCSGVMDVNAARDLVLIPITQELFDKVNVEIPAAVPVTIPAGTYSDVDYDVLAVGVPNPVVVSAELMSEDVAYELTKVILENATEGKYALVLTHPIAAQMTPENACKCPIPLHPGAEKYYKEVGVL